jgi:hypothetical protein
VILAVALARIVKPVTAAPPSPAEIAANAEQEERIHCSENYTHLQQAVYESLTWSDAGTIDRLVCHNQHRFLDILAAIPAERRHEFIAASLDYRDRR